MTKNGLLGIKSEKTYALISEADTNNKNIVKNIKVGDRFYSPIKKLETARIRAKIKLQGIKK